MGGSASGNHEASNSPNSRTSEVFVRARIVSLVTRAVLVCSLGLATSYDSARDRVALPASKVEELA